MSNQRLHILLQFHEEDPNDAFTRFALAQEYLKQGQAEKALSFFEGRVHDQPAFVGSYYHLGKLYEELDRKQDAVQIYQAGIRVAQEQKDFHAGAELQDALMQARGIGFEED
jgi:tetratricopeptide (TPR) repeat protein